MREFIFEQLFRHRRISVPPSTVLATAVFLVSIGPSLLLGALVGMVLLGASPWAMPAFVAITVGVPSLATLVFVRRHRQRADRGLSLTRWQFGFRLALFAVTILTTAVTMPVICMIVGNVIRIVRGHPPPQDGVHVDEGLMGLFIGTPAVLLSGSVLLVAVWGAMCAKPRHCCTRCGYDLRHLPHGGTCPECGTPVNRSEQDTP